MAKIFYENINKTKIFFFVSRKPRLKNHMILNGLKNFDVLINASPRNARFSKISKKIF